MKSQRPSNLSKGQMPGYPLQPIQLPYSHLWGSFLKTKIFPWKMLGSLKEHSMCHEKKKKKKPKGIPWWPSGWDSALSLQRAEGLGSTPGWELKPRSFRGRPEERKNEPTEIWPCKHSWQSSSRRGPWSYAFQLFSVSTLFFYPSPTSRCYPKEAGKLVFMMVRKMTEHSMKLWTPM